MILNSEYNKKTYSLAEVESNTGNTFSDYKKVIKLMRKLNIKWISKEDDIIELSSSIYPANPSLDFYNGYLFCNNNQAPVINQNGYTVLIPLENNWHFFVRRTASLR